MGTKQFSNYESLITFTRASAGHALRPVSYGDELVDTANTASSWTAYGTNTIAQNGDAVEVTYVDNAGGALDYLSQSHGTSEDLTAGKLYRLSFSAKTNQGSVRFQLYGQTISIQDFYITNTEYENFSVNFVSDGSQHLIKLNDMGAGEVFSIKNISVKEVTFDESGGRLTLFEHPNNVPRVEYVISDNKARFANINNHLLSASIGVEPQATEFDVLVGGRKIGDITNNGDVSAFDASQYLGWFEGTLTNQTYIDYIEGTLNPYIEENLEKYVLPYPAGINRLGLLVEESRTNLITYSEDFTHTSWTDSRATITSERIQGPDKKTDSGYKLEGDANTGSHRIYSLGFSVTSGTSYTFSIYMKAGEDDSPRLAFTDNVENSTLFNGANSTFDLTNGTADADGSIEDVGNGWYRCTLTGTAQSTDTGRAFLYLNNKDTTPFDGQGLYIFGAQVEEGSFPTSYIKTTGSTATRSVDVASIPVADFGFNANAGSFIVDFSSAGSDGADYPHAFSLDGSTVNDAIRMGLNTTNLKQFVVRDAGANQCVLNNGTYSPSDDLKISVAYKENDFASSDNGDAVVTDTSGTLPSVQTLSIGKWQNGSQTNGHIKSIKYYPRRLTNAQLEDLSS